jgi:hypothetical protein
MLHRGYPHIKTLAPIQENRRFMFLSRSRPPDCHSPSWIYVPEHLRPPGFSQSPGGLRLTFLRMGRSNSLSRGESDDSSDMGRFSPAFTIHRAIWDRNWLSTTIHDASNNGNQRTGFARNILIEANSPAFTIHLAICLASRRRYAPFHPQQMTSPFKHPRTNQTTSIDFLLNSTSISRP